MFTVNCQISFYEKSSDYALLQQLELGVDFVHSYKKGIWQNTVTVEGRDPERNCR